MPEINWKVFYFGVDPEVFLWDRKKKRYEPAHTVGQGTKTEPVPIPGRMYGTPYLMQVDGTALEFNTPSSVWTTDVKRYMEAAINLLSMYVKGKNEDLELKFEPTVTFDDEVWDSTPDDYKILGCDPDYCGWTMGINDPPDPDGKQYRTGAGHIHIGWTARQDVHDDDFFLVCGTLAKELDATLGVASVLFDNDTRRRTLYGKAGAFRPKPYGMEYRTLSNRWVGNKALRTYAFARATDALRNMMARRLTHTEDVPDIINNSKKDDALHWLRQHHLTLPPGMRTQ